MTKVYVTWHDMKPSDDPVTAPPDGYARVSSGYREALATIERVRALLTDGPGKHGRSWRDTNMDQSVDRADGAEVADAQWEAAIKKALGDTP